MVQVNILTNPHLELDCCPSCFNIWFDTGEFQTAKNYAEKIASTASERISSQQAPTSSISEVNAVYGQILQKHMDQILRYERIQKVGQFLSIRLYGRHRFRFWFRF